MTKGFWVAQQMRERELILEVLNEEDGPVDSLALWYAIDAIGTPVERGHFRRHLDYLGEKGYLRAELRNLGRLELKLVEITAKGRDLLSGHIRDPAVGSHATQEG